jgi:hypothetical protein
VGGSKERAYGGGGAARRARIIARGPGNLIDVDG